MKTRDEYAAEAEYLAGRANHYTYGDGGDVATGAAFAAEALVYATLATVAPVEPMPVPQPEPYIPVALSIRLRELHQNNGGDCGTCADETGGAQRWPCDTFTALDDAERQMSPEVGELDQADEAALDAAAEQDGGGR